MHARPSGLADNYKPDPPLPREGTGPAAGILLPTGLPLLWTHSSSTFPWWTCKQRRQARRTGQGLDSQVPLPLGRACC